MTRYVLSPTLSHRTLADVAILVDHGRGEISKLNLAAGRLLDQIAGERSELSADEIEFAEALCDRGLVLRAPAGDGAAGRHQPRKPATDGSALPSSSSQTPSTAPVGRQGTAVAARRADLIDRLNDHAAELLVPLHCQLELTYRCPLSCRYCYLHSERPRQADELSTDEVTTLLDDLAELGGLFLMLTGGEILLRTDLEAIVAHARTRRFAVSLLTSGWRLDRAMAARLVAGGLDSVQISLHGADSLTHDAMSRVEGSFEQALAALRLFRDLGARTLAAITVTRRNQASLGAMLELCERESLAPKLSSYVQPLRDGSREPQSITLDEASLREVLGTAPPGATARMAGRDLDDRPCGAGASAVAVDATGTVYPCHALRTAVGSIRQSSLRHIWSSSELLEQIRGLRVEDLQDCPSCPVRSRCNRCAGFSVGEGGDLTGHSVFDCLSARVIASMNVPNR